MPRIEKIFEGRKNREAYSKFCDYFLGYGIAEGADHFRNVKVKEKISDIASIVDEAFVLLALENGYDMWKHQVMKSRSMEDSGKEREPSWKWTANARVCKMGEGWQREGLNRFNELCSFVNDDRNTELGINTFGFENWYLKKCQDEANMKKRKRNRIVTVIPVVAFNMLIDKESENEDENENEKTNNGVSV